MIKIDIISGFLGAGKTTFIKKIIPHLEGKIALIENEFGDIGIDGDLIPDQLPIREIAAGCICCSLVHDFRKAIEELAHAYRPNHILIEPSGVGSLSDILKVCKNMTKNFDMDIKINRLITIVDVGGFNDYAENFGGFYLDQIRNANILLLSHFSGVDGDELEKIIGKIRENNPTALILKEDWYTLSGEKVIQLLNGWQENEINNPKISNLKKNNLKINKLRLQSSSRSKLKSANNTFNTFSVANPKVFLEGELEKIFAALKKQEDGIVLRAKGILQLESDKYIHFDFTPHHQDWRYINDTDYKTTKVAVIGSHINKEKIIKLFH